MKVAIVILNWNGCEMLKKFLPSVLLHSSNPDTAIYVADNGSTDQSVAMLRENFPNIHLIILDKNYGFAEGYNLALKEIEAEYVVLLNSDVEVTQDWLTPLTEYMDAHPEVAACQPKIRSWHHRELFEYAGASGGFIDKYGYPFCRGRIRELVEKDNGQYNSIIPVFWATGAAMFIRLEEYRQAGGLDERFFAHMEEIDLCWRLRSRGKQIVCIPQSVVYHVGGATLKKENPRKTFLNFRNSLVTLYKNLPEEELSGILFARRWLDYLAILVFILKGDTQNAKAVIKARKEYTLIRKDFSAKRAENLEKTTVQSIPERAKNSILAQYYLKRKKYYSQIYP